MGIVKKSPLIFGLFFFLFIAQIPSAQAMKCGLYLRIVLFGTEVKVSDTSPVTAEEAEAARQHFIANARWPFRGRQKSFMAAEYNGHRANGIDHDIAMNAAVQNFSKDYIELRNAGISHDNAVEASENVKPKDYLLLVANNIKHDDAIAALSNHNAEPYLKLRKNIITHDDAIEILELTNDIDTYIKLRNEGVLHDDAYSAMSDYSGEDIDFYSALRKSGLDHDDAAEIVGNYNYSDYTKLKQAGARPHEIIEVLQDENATVSAYVDLRNSGTNHYDALNGAIYGDDFVELRKAGVFTNNSIEVIESETVTVGDYLKMHKAKIGHTDIFDVIENDYDIDKYIELRGHMDHGRAMHILSED